MEKFYCVGCKNHYELEVVEAVEKPSKGGSIRYSLVSRCPKGHKTTKICKREVYDSYSSMEAETIDTTPVEAPASEPEGSEPTPAGPSAVPAVDDPRLEVPKAFCAEHNESFEACGCEKKSAEDVEMTDEEVKEIITVVLEEDNPPESHSVYRKYPMEKVAMAMKLTGTRPSLKEWISTKVSKDAETIVGTMTPGVNLEALTPLEGGLENGDGEPLVPADDFLPEGSGRVIGSQSTSHNYTPMHAEDVGDDEDVCDSCGIVCGLDEMVYFVDEDDAVHQSACSACFDSEEVEMIYVGEPRSWADRNRAKLATAAAALALGILYFNSQKKE